MTETQIIKPPSNRKAWIWGLICGLYIVSPIDIIPDVIPVFGWMDDIFIGVGGTFRVILYVLAARKVITILYPKVKELITLEFIKERTKIEVPEAFKIEIMKVRKDSVNVGIFDDNSHKIAEMRYESSIGVDPSLHHSRKKYEITT